jgi:hypothetical protein
MNVNQVAQYRPKQLQHTRVFLQRLLNTPTQFLDHIRQSGSFVCL